MSDLAASGDGASRAEEAGMLEAGDRLLAQGDVDGAQAAYERVEAAGDVSGTLKLAALLEDHRDDREAAEAAWRRADEAGSLNGAGNLGRLLREMGDVAGAEAAFRRCVDRGSMRAIGDWAALLFGRGDATPEEISEAAVLLCGAHDRFIQDEDLEVAAAVMMTDVMRERGDATAVEAGTRTADERGSAAGAWHLAWTLRAKGDLPGAAEAFRRAGERGHDDAWVNGASTLMALGDRDAAEAMARSGDQAGSASASGILGAILDERGLADEALEAYRRAMPAVTGAPRSTSGSSCLIVGICGARRRRSNGRRSVRWTMRTSLLPRCGIRSSRSNSDLQRREAKKSCRSAVHSDSSTPPTTSGRWFRAGSASTSRTLPAAPALGSGAP